MNLDEIIWSYLYLHFSHFIKAQSLQIQNLIYCKQTT